MNLKTVYHALLVYIKKESVEKLNALEDLANKFLFESEGKQVIPSIGELQKEEIKVFGNEASQSSIKFKMNEIISGRILEYIAGQKRTLMDSYGFETKEKFLYDLFALEYSLRLENKKMKAIFESRTSNMESFIGAVASSNFKNICKIADIDQLPVLMGEDNFALFS